MALLLGVEGTRSGTNVANTAGKMYAFRVEGKSTGSVQKLVVLTGTGANTGATAIWVGLYTDAAESKPGTLLCTGKVEAAPPGQSTTYELTPSSNPEVKSGTFYHLVVLWIGAAGHTQSDESETQRRLSSLSTYTKPEEGATWAAAAAKAPGSVWATGEALAVITPKVEAQLEVKANVSGGSGAFSFTAKAESVLEVAAEIQSAQEGVFYNKYYGPTAEKAAEETTRSVKATEHNCRFLDIWPAASAGAATIVVIHGGGWSGGGKQEKEAVPRQCNEHGYCAFNIDYRYASETVGAFPKEIADLEEAITYAKTNAATYNGNPNNIYLIGGSAGGHLAAEAARKMNASEVKVRGVIPMSGIFNFTPFVEEMESGAYFEPEGGHAGGNADNLIEHTQFALQQTLEGGHAAPENPPIVAGKTKTNVAGSRTKQKEVSPTEQTIPAVACRWFSLWYEEDLIPTGQFTGFKSHLETEKRSLKTKEIATHGHGFSMWGNPTIRTEVFAFIDAAVATPVVEMELAVKATFVGQSGGGGRGSFVELAIVGKHSKFRSLT